MHAIPLRRWRACAAIFGQIVLAVVAAPLAAVSGYAHRPRPHAGANWSAKVAPVRVLAA